MTGATFIWIRVNAACSCDGGVLSGMAASWPIRLWESARTWSREVA